MVCTSLGSQLRPLFYFLCYIHFSLSVETRGVRPSYGSSPPPPTPPSTETPGPKTNARWATFHHSLNSTAAVRVHTCMHVHMHAGNRSIILIRQLYRVGTQDVAHEVE